MRSWLRTHPNGESDIQPTAMNLDLAIRIHNELSRLVTPATASSIRASSIRGNWTLAFIFIMSIFAFVLLILSALLPDGIAQIKTVLQIIGAATLGSAFYQLYTATDYLLKRTFDPSYNQIYLIRFALGIISGVIMGQFGGDLLKSNGGNLASVGAATFALVGGFSAEVVYLVLQRFADTMVTAIRGTGKERAQAAAEQDTARKMTDTAAQIHDALDANLSPDEQQKRLREVAKTIVSPKK